MYLSFSIYELFEEIFLANRFQAFPKDDKQIRTRCAVYTDIQLIEGVWYRRNSLYLANTIILQLL
jgi:hypothetical protein